MVSAPLDMVDAPLANKERLRLWIRLLRVARIVEGELRERLRRDFDSTLPRFDVMSALYRQSDGMLMSDLSRFLLVSNGNVTGIIDRLVTDGYVVRSNREGDRRTSIVRLTDSGLAQFRAMAAAHETWIAELLGEIGETEARTLSSILKSFRSNWEGEH
ncbi:MarR family transcriptional regulator [Mesorhizobium sp. CAU 1732]|uniref:MarR family winged helix-turn-helix transcriptional regulator n=1 Tax=Mesorhizobium sp. CAU 1732 TaxID=3140358 RepID=UPI0032615CDE